MKVSSVATFAALSCGASAIVTFPIAKVRGVSNLKKRQLSPRATITESLANNFTGGDYIAQVTVGTPGQTQTLAIDTGSSDVWLMSSTADLCNNSTLQDYYGTGGCASTFDSSKSSSFKVVDKDGFNIQYADNSGAAGDYVTDDFSIGGATIKSLEMGLAYNVSLQTGLMGVGYDLNEASDSSDGESQGFVYPSIIDQMVSQGLISTKAYSLYLNDYEASTGSIIFGGLDTDKYHGKLLQIPIVADKYPNGTAAYAEFSVALSGVGITSQSGTTTNFTSNDETAAILDSGTTLTYLPNHIVEDIYTTLNASEDDNQNVYVDCSVRDNNPKLTFNFAFGGSNGVIIAVPVSEMVFDLTGLFSEDGYTPIVPGIDNPCALGLYPGDSEGSSGGPYILGDTFLRSAYVVYDLKNNLIALAQTNFNSTTSSIVEFQASATSIPNVSGVASSAQITETATGILGGGGGLKTTTGSGSTPTNSKGSSTGSAGSTSSTSKSAAAGTVPAFDMGGLIVLGLSSVFAVLGGALVLA